MLLQKVLGVLLVLILSYSANQQQAQKDSRNHSISITRQASARTKKEHKYSVKVSSVVGEEDANSRVIRNPSETNSLRLDYYQLIRKWKCELFQYDLRMTYDIVIPNPGGELAKRIMELYELDRRIDEEKFQFDVPLSHIQPGPFNEDLNSWGYYVKKYSVGNVNPLPELEIWKTDQYQTPDYGAHKEATYYGKFEFEVDPNYEIKDMVHHTVYNSYGDTPHIFDIFQDDKPDNGLNNQTSYGELMGELCRTS